MGLTCDFNYVTKTNMIKLLSYATVLGCFLAFSCDDNDLSPDAGFIRATIDGVETVYKTLPAEADSYNYIRPGVIDIRFNKDATSSQYFSIKMIPSNFDCRNHI